jgi:hypothetical protein
VKPSQNGGKESQKTVQGRCDMQARYGKSSAAQTEDDSESFQASGAWARMCRNFI